MGGGGSRGSDGNRGGGGSRGRVERYPPLHDTVLKRYRVAQRHPHSAASPISAGNSSPDSPLLTVCERSDLIYELTQGIQ